MYSPIQEMGELIYAGVAENNSLLFEHSKSEFLSGLVKKLLSRDLSLKFRSSFSYEDKYQVHILYQSRYKFIAITTSEYLRKLAYEFLEDVKDGYLSNPNSTKRGLVEKVKKYNEDQAEIKIVKTRNQLKEINSLMLISLDRILNPGTKKETGTVDEDVECNSESFRSGIGRNKSNCCRLNKKCGFFVICVVLCVVAAAGVLMYFQFLA